MQRSVALRLFDRLSRSRFGLLVAGARLSERDRRCVLGVTQRRGLGGYLAAKHVELRRQRNELRLLFFELKLLGSRVELDQHVAGLHLFAHSKMGRDNATGDGRFYRMHGVFYFEPCCLGRFIQRNSRQKNPRDPDGQDQHDRDESER